MNSSRVVAEVLNEGPKSPRLCNSMTNSTYRIVFQGTDAVIRIPNKSTSRYISRDNEYGVFSDYSNQLNSITALELFRTRTGLLITKDMSNTHHIMDNQEDYLRVIKLLRSVHSIKYHKDKYVIDLIKDLDNYKKVYSGLVVPWMGFEKYGEEVIKPFIRSNQRDNEYLCHRDLIWNNILLSNDESSNDILLDWEYCGVLNFHWDIASFLCETRLCSEDFSDSFVRKVLTGYYYNNPVHKSELNYINKWMCVVDYIWAAWALAKYAHNVDYYDYGKLRYDLSKDWKRYEEN